MVGPDRWLLCFPFPGRAPLLPISYRTGDTVQNMSQRKRRNLQTENGFCPPLPLLPTSDSCLLEKGMLGQIRGVNWVSEWSKISELSQESHVAFGRPWDQVGRHSLSLLRASRLVSRSSSRYSQNSMATEYHVLRRQLVSHSSPNSPGK